VILQSISGITLQHQGFNSKKHRTAKFFINTAIKS
jgi:hypothetical protein